MYIKKEINKNKKKQKEKKKETERERVREKPEWLYQSFSSVLRLPLVVHEGTAGEFYYLNRQIYSNRYNYIFII